MPTVLHVSYPFAAVSRDSVGGAEQVIAAIDSALVREGWRSVVVAAEGSRTDGELITTPPVSGTLSPEVLHAARQRHRRAIEAAIDRFDVDLLHFHGVDCAEYFPPPETSGPSIVTLHLPPQWYPPAIFERDDLHLVCVSEAEARVARRFDAVIPNGVNLEAFAPDPHFGGDSLVCLGRICEEKNFHVAVEAARRAGRRLFIAGEVFGYPEHQRYFDEVLAPALDADRTFIGPVRMPGKRDLLAHAAATIVPSVVPETSSLAAMESLACGTPVIAWRSGALPEIVEHGVTGFIVDSMDELVSAIRQLQGIDRRACRRAAETRYDVRTMAKRYLSMYESLSRNAAAETVSYG